MQIDKYLVQLSMVDKKFLNEPEFCSIFLNIDTLPCSYLA